MKSKRGSTVSENGPAVSVQVLLEYDDFRWVIREVDGIFHFEYEEWTGETFEKKSTFEGLWCSDVNKICEALQLVASKAEM